MLDVQEIHTYYGDSYVLQGISLRIEPGRVVGLLGRNGMGKTTLIRSIVGFTPPRRGRVLFKNHDITGWVSNPVVGLGLGLVPQGRRVFPTRSVHENLAVALKERKGPWTLDRVMEQGRGTVDSPSRAEPPAGAPDRRSCSRALARPDRALGVARYAREEQRGQGALPRTLKEGETMDTPRVYYRQG